jgi:hypothetical protein
MFQSPIRTIKRSASDSLFRRKVLSASRPRVDPFNEFSTKVVKTPVLKPACHKTATSEKTIIFRPKPTIVKTSFAPLKFQSKFNKKSPHFKNSSTFIIKTDQHSKNDNIIINPTFSAKNSVRSTQSNFKPVLRVKKIITSMKNPSNPEVFQKKMLKRVNNLIFKEKYPRYKSALEFSFANPF